VDLTLPEQGEPVLLGDVLVGVLGDVPEEVLERLGDEDRSDDASGRVTHRCAAHQVWFAGDDADVAREGAAPDQILVHPVVAPLLRGQALEVADLEGVTGRVRQDDALGGQGPLQGRASRWASARTRAGSFASKAATSPGSEAKSWAAVVAPSSPASRRAL